MQPGIQAPPRTRNSADQRTNGCPDVIGRTAVILQAPQRLHVDVRAPGDTMTVFHPPLDTSPVERVIRWFFSVPQWVQLTGAALAIVVGVVALVLVWQNAGAIRAWIRERHLTTPLVWKAVIGLLAVVVLLGMAGAGAAFFVYSQNNNQFCLSCHTLHDEVYQRFQQSKHHRVANLRCHDCHDEPLVAEMAQVGKWMLWRPSEVGPHAPVPREVCAGCHVKQNPDSTWQRIIATAGHSVHLLTDTARKLNVECLTCHGVTAHRFVPVAQTCAQSGCHKQMDIQLGKMAGQTSLHCVTCHQFTAPVRETRNAKVALDVLAPSERSCLGCHEMRKVIERFVPDERSAQGAMRRLSQPAHADDARGGVQDLHEQRLSCAAGYADAVPSRHPRRSAREVRHLPPGAFVEGAGKVMPRLSSEHLQEGSDARVPFVAAHAGDGCSAADPAAGIRGRRVRDHRRGGGAPRDASAGQVRLRTRHHALLARHAQPRAVRGVPQHDRARARLRQIAVGARLPAVPS